MRTQGAWRVLLVLGLLAAGSDPADGRGSAAQSAPDSGAEEASDAPDPVPVGVPAWKRELVLEGSELQVRPGSPASLLVLRIAAVYPHGSAFRYDIEYYGVEAGSFDLVHYLERADGSATDDLSAVPVVIESSLPPGIVRPNAIEDGSVPDVGGYKQRMVLLGLLWLAGLVGILSWGRRSRAAALASSARPVTVADRLRRLVERGMAGELSRGESAQLELTLIAFWRRKLGLRERSSAEALRELKQHPEAGPLLEQLELWMHSPDGGGDVDVEALLAPYQDLAPDDLDVPEGGAAAAPR